MQRLINEDGGDGTTSNPAKFEKAIIGSPYCRDDLERLHGDGLNAEACYASLVIADIRAVPCCCRLFRLLVGQAAMSVSRFHPRW